MMLMVQILILLTVARSGLLPSLIGVCHVAVQFPLYEYCKAKIAEKEGTTVDRLDPLSVVSFLPSVSWATSWCHCFCVTSQLISLGPFDARSTVRCVH